MATENRPVRRALLYLAAVLFGAATTFYSFLWYSYAPQSSTTNIGAELTYSLSSHSLRVSRVLRSSNAQQAGLRAGDEILAINGVKLDTLTPYYDEVARGKGGDTVSFSVLHAGEASPRVVPVVLTPPRATQFFQAMTPAKAGVLRIMRIYPMVFLVVGLAVLFLKVQDRNAWLVALFFASFIALPDLPPGVFPPAIRGYTMVFHVALAGLEPALIYFLLAVFPAASPLDRRVPWLKWAFIIAGGVSVAVGLWTIVEANAYQSTWLPISYGGPAWLDLPDRALSLMYSPGGDLLALVSLGGNSLCATTAETRRKARVIAWGIACGLLPIIFLTIVLFLSGKPFQVTPFWLYASCVLALMLLPLSFAYAVVKHRVLEIPLLLKRGARYLLVQRGFVFLAVLVTIAVSLLFITVFTRFIRTRSEIALPAGLSAGMLFGVLLAVVNRRVAARVTKRIDRAFFRSAYDAGQVLEDLAQRTRKAAGREHLARLLESEIGEALHPVSVAVYLEEGDGRFRLQHDAPESASKPIAWRDWPELYELSCRGEPFEVPPAQTSKDPPPAAFGRTQPECLVPLVAGEGRVTGIVALGARLSEEPYSREDKRLLALVASQAGLALESIRLGEQIADRIEAERRTAQEMEFARQVQARLFPQKQPTLKTLEYTGACVQARQVGGDYYDFFELRRGRLALVLADIAGKGVSGALLMANLQANLRSQYAMALDNLPQLLNSVNQLFYENSAENSYATLFFGDYDDRSRRLRYANCGHLPPLLLRSGASPRDQVSKTQKVEFLHSTCTVVGLFKEWQCEIADLDLAPGDTLVLYTDGVTEAEGSEGEEFGEARLIQALYALRHLPLSSALDGIVANVKDFSQGQQADDITLVMARCRA